MAFRVLCALKKQTGGPHMDTEQFWSIIEHTKDQSDGDQDKQQALLADELAAHP
jgi:hypothetical protein